MDGRNARGNVNSKDAGHFLRLWQEKKRKMKRGGRSSRQRKMANRGRR